MKRLVVLALSLAPIAAADPREPKRYTIEDFLEGTWYTGGSFAPGHSKILVGSDASGIFNAYAIPVNGGDPLPLTASKKESIWPLSYFPHDERILYTSDRGGNELAHLYVRELDGRTRDLTPGDQVKANFVGWAHDGKSFFAATTARDQKVFDLYEFTTDGYHSQLVFKNDGAFHVAAVSRDKRFIALGKIHTDHDSDIHLFDTTTKELRHLTEHEGDINHIAQDFSPDGKSLLLTTDRESDFRYLARLDLESGAITPVKRFSWDVLFGYYSWGGNYLLLAVNEDASTDLHLYRVQGETLTEVALPQVQDADINRVRLSRDEKHLALFASTSKGPHDLYFQRVGDNAPPRRLTRSLSNKIDPDDLVEGKVVRFKSFDGLEIPGILFTPHQADPENKVPALVWVHGGPGGQSRLRYHPLIQYLVNHGYLLYAINNRGSSGYGKVFNRLDDRNHGKGDLDDCVASKKMLIETGVVDPERIGIIGGSYGGYMTLAALAFRPGQFQAGVDIFGVSNWVRTLNSTPPWWEAIRKALAAEIGDFDDTEYLESISPLFHAHKIRQPLIVLQGANDPRVLQAESDDIVAAVRKNNVPVEYLVFEDEGHGFTKKPNRIKGYRAIKQFLDRYLKAPPN